MPRKRCLGNAASDNICEIAVACVCVCVACMNACVYVRVFQCIRYVTASGSVSTLTLFAPDPSLVLSGMQNICSKDDGTKAQRPSGAGSSTPAGTEGPVLAAESPKTLQRQCKDNRSARNLVQWLTDAGGTLPANRLVEF